MGEAMPAPFTLPPVSLETETFGVHGNIEQN